MRRSQQYQELRELSDWDSRYGVLSIVLNVEPSDRGEKWRIELKNVCHDLLEQHNERSVEHAVREAISYLSSDDVSRHGLLHVGFIESDGKRLKRQWWRCFQLETDIPTQVVFRERPFLQPLLSLASVIPARGVALISGDHVRLLQTQRGELEELEHFEIELFTPDWRERKAQTSSDPTKAQGVSSSGHDQHQQRLQANRQHFLKDVGHQLEELAARHNWAEALIFGEHEYAQELKQGIHNGLLVSEVDEHNLISEHNGQLRARIEEQIHRQQSEYERQQLESMISAEGETSKSVILGPERALEALREGRVASVLLAGSNGLKNVAEEIIELALATSAEITWLHQQPQRLETGVAARLRY